jgi:multidrug resistance efflux pump
MKIFYAGIGLVVSVLTVMSFQWQSGDNKVSSFYGVVDTAETMVSAELAVEIVKLHVVPGQLVNEGDPLVDLSSSELERNIAELRHSLNEARVARIAEDREIQAQVAEYEAQYKLNRSLLSQVRGGGRDDGVDEAGESPLTAAITGLKGMLAREELSTVDMEAYLSLLLREREKLTVVAPGPGLIGTVHRRTGEKVKAFEPVLSLYTGAPTTVRGYIHESAHSLIENGQRVQVRSLAARYEVAGQVVGVGHRIVEYPVRLRKRAEIQTWGREVIIRIPDSNAFLLGEKVMIEMDPTTSVTGGKSSGSAFPGLSAHASSPSSSAATHAQADRTTNSGNDAASVTWSLPGVEASGIVYISSADKFLVVSDDTPQKSPVLQVVSPDGATQSTTTIVGLAAINDMESIAEDVMGRLYIATSQSRNKSGKFPQTRRLLVRAVRSNPSKESSTSYTLESSVLLHDALAAAAQGNAAEWALWFREATQAGTLDMEGMALHESGILLGFKAPLHNSRSMILYIHDREALMGGKALTSAGVSLWAAPVLNLAAGGVSHGISDMVFHKGELHVVGTAVREDAHDGVTAGGGGWWIVSRDGTARLQRAFPGVKPEGLSYDPTTGAWRIALDEGSNKPSRVLSARPQH